MTPRRLSWLAIVIVALTAACSPGEGSPAGLASSRPSMPARISQSPQPSPAVVPAEPPLGDATPAPVATPTTPPVVGSRPEVLFERRVSPIPRSAADRGFEPVVATHPTDPQRIAVVYVHRGPGAACSINPVIRISRDGGRTWRSTPSSPGSRSSRGMGLHAAIAWGPGPRGRARLYWANMTTPGCGTGRFSLTTSYSDDEGRTWSPLRVERSTPPWVGGFPDVAVDRNPQSPNYGAVYVAYNWVGRSHGPGFRLLASSDFGRTWQRSEVPPVRLAKGALDRWRIAYRLRTAPEGRVYATWYQVDMRRWDRSNIFDKGGPANVRRLGVGMAQVRFDRRTGSLEVGRPRLIARVDETAWTTSALSAPGTAGNIRPDPMWQYGFDVGADGSLHVAVAGYGPRQGAAPRGTVKVGQSDDGGRTWTFTTLRAARNVAGRPQSSLRPNLVVGNGYVAVTMRLLDDVGSGATMGVGFAVSLDGGRTWSRPLPVNGTRWWASDLAGVVNGAGLRERAERTAEGDVLWAYGDGRLARHIGAGATAIFATRISLTVP